MSNQIRRTFHMHEKTYERACELAEENGFVTRATEKAKPVDLIISIFRWVIQINASEDMRQLREFEGDIGVIEALKEAWRHYINFKIGRNPRGSGTNLTRRVGS